MKKSGFTLIELLVVVAIIGLLSTLSVLALNTARARSRDARRISDIKQIQTALEMYYNAAGGYPDPSLAYSEQPIAYEGDTFLKSYPYAPPTIDGSCASFWSGTPPMEYYYYNDGDGYLANNGIDAVYSSYQILYCLGAKTGDIPAGEHVASPGKIY